MSFSNLALHPSLERGLKDLGFRRPTPIQSSAIPPALEGRDLLATAMTGSGKTAAFLLPILHQLIAKPRGTTRALVLTPTRELAAQILADLDDLATHTPVTAAAVFGGVGMGPQAHAFRSGVDVIVGTPGRLLDHFRSPYAKLAGLEHLVLDEADRMLDMGFLPDIRRILRHLPAKRQTMLFSATMPAPIAELAREMLRQPVLIDVERPSATATGITQAVYPVPQALKASLLVRLLKDEIRDALVFTRTKHRADRLTRHLATAGIEVERIHGNRSQAQRTAALAGFKSGTFRVLVATDIAARGIDVSQLGHVVNFDVPAVVEDYVHRVGRTGRMDAVGAGELLHRAVLREHGQWRDRLGREQARQVVEQCERCALDHLGRGGVELDGSRGGQPGQRRLAGAQHRCRRRQAHQFECAHALVHLRARGAQHRRVDHVDIGAGDRGGLLEVAPHRLVRTL